MEEHHENTYPHLRDLDRVVHRSTGGLLEYHVQHVVFKRLYIVQWRLMHRHNEPGGVQDDHQLRFRLHDCLDDDQDVQFWWWRLGRRNSLP
jgi:hypothetical protein